MSPPSLGVEVEVQSKLKPSLHPVKPGFTERNYFKLSECSSVDSSTVTSFKEDKKGHLNLKATELRLGLPGSQSPGRDPQLCLLSPRKLDERSLFPVFPSKDVSALPCPKAGVSGNKRGFSDTTKDVEKTYDGQGKFPVNGAINVMLSSRPSLNSGVKTYSVNEQSGANYGLKENMGHKVLEKARATGEMGSYQMDASNSNYCAPAAKAQVVGWPPIRSYRKNTLATTSKNNEEAEGKSGAAPLFVKVSMDGAPYLRKVDLSTYSIFLDLSSALGKMFGCFTLGQCGSNEPFGKESMNENNLNDLLHGSEYVLTYEDKDGDWMLVGDVPWKMFIDSCKRLKIMKSSDAIGLAPRVLNKSGNKV
ncbi:hypothetical protein Drorol1_Dr00011050 [Drosera rotundifolia]